MPLTAKQTMLEAILAQANGGEPLPPLNPDQIDQCVQEYELAERAADAADAQLKNAKLGLIALVQQHGTVPPHAEQSRRLTGRRNQATITVATTLELDANAIADLQAHLEQRGLPSLFDKLFTGTLKWTLVRGAKEVLAQFQLGQREADKTASLFGLCIVPKPKAPSLKVELIVPEKPVRTPRAKKEVA